MIPLCTFSNAMQDGNYLWILPSAGADVAGEQMAWAVHKHPYLRHICVVPRLMTGCWRRRVAKTADFKLSLDVGFKHWERERHGPLLIFVCLPLCKHSPWKLPGCSAVAHAEGKLRMVSGSREGRIGSLLCQLFMKAQRMDAMPEGLVRGMLQHPCFKPFPNTNAGGRQRL
jgi:hypothetical protein